MGFCECKYAKQLLTDIFNLIDFLNEFSGRMDVKDVFSELNPYYNPITH